MTETAPTVSAVLFALMAAEPVAKCEYSRMVVAAHVIERVGCPADLLHKTMRGLTEQPGAGEAAPRALTFYASSNDHRFLVYRLNPAYLAGLAGVSV